MQYRAPLVATVFVALTGAGCDIQGRFPRDITGALYALQGQSLDTAITRIGLPAAQQSVAGRKIFVWVNSDTVTAPQAQPIIDPMTGNLVTAFYANTRQWYCIVRAVVNDQNIITYIEISANSVFYCPRA